jgi:hypothetical protein
MSAVDPRGTISDIDRYKNVVYTLNDAIHDPEVFNRASLPEFSIVAAWINEGDR